MNEFATRQCKFAPLESIWHIILMQWDDLKFVLAAARSKSFAKAAAML